MTRMPKHVLAQRRGQELLTDAQEKRRAMRPHAAPGPPRRMRDVLLGRRRRDNASGRGSCNAILASAEDCRDFALNDGRSVRIRPLRLTDRTKYEEAVAGLSARSRYLRFAAPLPRMSEHLLDQMMQIDGNRHVAYTALTQDETTIVGVARYIRSSEDPHSAEVAFAVADDWQGHGLGRQLFGRVVEHAWLADLHSLTATTLSENRLAARLLRAVGFSVVRRAGMYTEYEMRLNSAVGGMS